MIRKATATEQYRRPADGGRLIGTGGNISIKLSLAAVLALGACKKSTDTAVTIETASVDRRSIVLSVQANGTVEPVNIVEVKSKASGTITRMPVDIGANVKTGDLLVQIDPRDVQNQYDQAAADVSSATVQRATALAQRNRSAELYKEKIITAQEMDQASLDFANADAALIKARTNLSIARVRLEDATVRAPTNGTIIEKPVAEGMVITSATTSASGGTTILKMADLTKVRMRAFVNETDIGSVMPGQSATVTVDAFPNRRFVGIVAQVEPEAVVQSSVTMFPVLVTLNNLDGALKPGMNGQVVMDIARHDNVLAIPSDAVRNTRDASTVAPVLGVPADSIRKVIAAARAGRAARLAQGTASSTTQGDTARRRFGGQGGPGGDTAAFRQRVAQGSSSSSSTGRGLFGGFSRQGGGFGGGSGGGGGGAGGSSAASGSGGTTGTGGPMIVFVKTQDKYTPHVVRLGISDFDYTEVLSGLQQGQQVALLGPAVLQAQREQVQARVRAGTGGGLQQQQTPTGGAGGAAGTGGARGGGGGGGGRPPGT
ncbi:MAG TPA: efflux RND transporter periplasmic adaptor subunit [Gemmatimonadaceae bacterium]|nr:efflux RND transporter periplasmic adaptor subunit [Gemmatimonadaceae bacterium]